MKQNENSILKISKSQNLKISKSQNLNLFFFNSNM